MNVQAVAHTPGLCELLRQHTQRVPIGRQADFLRNASDADLLTVLHLLLHDLLRGNRGDVGIQSLIRLVGAHHPSFKRTFPIGAAAATPCLRNGMQEDAQEYLAALEDLVRIRLVDPATGAQLLPGQVRRANVLQPWPYLKL